MEGVGKWEQKAAMGKWLRRRERDRWEGWTPPPQGPLELPYVGPHPIKQKLEKKRKDGMIRPFWSTH